MAVDTPQPPRGPESKRTKSKGRVSKGASHDELTAREREALDYYVAAGEQNITHSMIRAGYATSYASTRSHEFLKNPRVARALEAKRALIALKSEVTIADTVGELARIGFADPRKLFRKIEMPKLAEATPEAVDANPAVAGRIGKKPAPKKPAAPAEPERTYYELIPVPELDEATARAVAEVTVELNAAGIVTKTKVKLWPKTVALSDIMRHLGGFAKDNAQKADPMDGFSPEERTAHRMKLAERKAELLAMQRDKAVGLQPTNAPTTKVLQ